MLLNVAISAYQNPQLAQKAAIIDLLFAFAHIGGLQPFCKILESNGKPLIGSRVSRFRRDNIVTVGILAPRPSPTAVKLRARLKFTKPAHIYDQRSGRYFGNTDSVVLTLSSTSATMLSLLPYGVDDLKVSDATTVAAGSEAKLSVTLQTSGETVPEGHIYRVRLRNPKGDDIWHYARTLGTDGPSNKPTSIILPFAYNDPPGTWAVTVRDVATRLERVVKIFLLSVK